MIVWVGWADWLIIRFEGVARLERGGRNLSIDGVSGRGYAGRALTDSPTNAW